MRRLSIILALLTGLIGFASGQLSPSSSGDIGIPKIINYSPRDYGQHSQNWDLIRDRRGVLYVANGNGILEFDGLNWEIISTPQFNRGRSFAIDQQGVVYSGVSSDFGYLAADSIGQTVFVSLKEKLEEKDRIFTEVWRTHTIGDAVYFQTYEKLIRWQNGKLKVWDAGEDRFFLSHQSGGNIFIQQSNNGILTVQKDQLHQAIPHGQLGDTGVYSIFSVGENNMLVSKSGVQIWTDNLLVPFSTTVDRLIAENSLSCALPLGDGNFALGFHDAGIKIIGADGELRLSITKEDGLIDDDVKSLYVDGSGGFWAALNYGLARISWPAPMTFFTEKQGLRGNVEQLAEHQQDLYAATAQGVFKLTATVSTGAAFEQLPQLDQQAFDLFSVGEDLLIGGNTMLAVYRNGKTRVLREDLPSIFAFLQPDGRQDILLIGMTDGVGLLRKSRGQWQFAGNIENVNYEVRTMAQDEDGRIWMATYQQGAGYLRLSADSQKLLQPEVTWLTPEEGMPGCEVINAGLRVLFLTDNGLRAFDAQKKRLVPDSSLGAALADTSLIVGRLAPLSDQEWLVRTGYELNAACWLINAAADQPKPGIDKVALREIPRFGAFHTALPGEKGISWLGCDAGIIRFDSRQTKTIETNYSPLIRRIINLKTGRILMGNRQSDLQPLPYSQNAIAVDYVLPDMQYPDAVRYRCRLQGFEDHWSDWTTATRREYTNLPEGDYRFQVEAKNLYDHKTRIAAIDFIVKTPWFRAWWAWIIYALLGFTLFAGLMQLRVRAMTLRQEALEQTIAQRTAEVVQQRNQLEQQSRQLQEMDQLKSRFFANISHEFRTPLTIILGLLDRLRTVKEKAPAEDSYAVMHNNAARLLQLINQLLDLSKLEAHQLKLQAARADIMPLIKRVIASFASLSDGDQKTVTLNGKPPAEGGIALKMWFDQEKLEKVLYNLLSNAVKFTPNGGRIDVSLAVESADDDSNEVKIAVSNSGPGIPAEQLPFIFDRFYQADSGDTRRFEGTGIGLALVKELVELHHGTITATSKPGVQTQFIVRLPLGRSAFTEDELFDHQQPTSALPTQVVTKVGAEAEAETPPAETPKDDQPLVLVVEDHSDLRRFIAQTLQSAYHVQEARNGLEGWEKAIEIIPDLIISDIMMPDMDGYQLCEKLKSSDKTDHIPVILLTARATSEDKIEGLKTGADDYLYKPFDPQELLVRVNNLIENRQQMREKFSKEMLLKPSAVIVPSTQQVFLERLTSVIESHLEDEAFTVEILSGEIGMSRGQLHRKLTALTNQSPSEFVRNFRLQRAADLLLQDAGNIAEIAYQVGFNSQAYFTRTFQERYGCTPSEYRRKAQA